MGSARLARRIGQHLLRFMLDTNICIYLLSNSKPLLTQRVAECDAGSLTISSIVFAELAFGSARGKLPPAQLLDAFISEVPVLPFDEVAALSYATMKFQRGSFDQLIAAHALSLGLTLVTANSADFAAVQGLQVESWAL